MAEKTTYIILRKIPFQDSSLIVSGLSPEFGRLDFLLRGARGTARIRLSLNAAHTDADVEHLIEAVRRISADHGNRTTH